MTRALSPENQPKTAFKVLISLFFLIFVTAQPLGAGQKSGEQGDQMQSFRTVKLIAENSILDGTGFDTVVFNDEVWIVGGDEREDVYSSKDLLNWRKQSDQENLLLLDHSLLAFKNKLWVVLGSGLSGYSHTIWSSNNGKNWQKNKKQLPFPTRMDHAATVFQDRMWVLGGMAEGLEPLDDVWSSKDGLNWDLEYSHAAFGPRYDHASVVFDNKIWVIGGIKDGGEDSNEVWYSSDGKTWTLATDSPGFTSMTNTYHATAYAGKIWVGTWGDNGWSLWSSIDGKNWEELRPAEPLFTEVESLVVFQDKLFVFVFGAVWQVE